MPCCAMQVAQYPFDTTNVTCKFSSASLLKLLLEDEASVAWYELQKLI